MKLERAWEVALTLVLFSQLFARIGCGSRVEKCPNFPRKVADFRGKSNWGQQPCGKISLTKIQISLLLLGALGFVWKGWAAGCLLLKKRLNVFITAKMYSFLMNTSHKYIHLKGAPDKQIHMRYFWAKCTYFTRMVILPASPLFPWESGRNWVKHGLWVKQWDFYWQNRL